MGLRLGVVSHALGRQRAIEFSDKIQRATAKGLIINE
jgi:putative effector of murein hydrolase